MTTPTSLRIIHDEHSALSAMLMSLRMMYERGPGESSEAFFDVLRAMLFYIDEFPERLHHPKESELLFPRVLRAVPQARASIERLDKDHHQGEARVRELQHKLLAWELLGDTRKQEFVDMADRYIDFYLDHMRLEEHEILPLAQQHLSAADWAELDAAFDANRDPMTGKYPIDKIYDRLFTRIVMAAPEPVGLGNANGLSGLGAEPLPN